MKPGDISPSMNVNTKPDHRITINGHWVLIDPKMPKDEFITLANKLEQAGYNIKIPTKKP